MQTLLRTNFLLAAIGLSLAVSVQAEDAKGLQRKLESKYTLTVVNAEGATVTQGVVLRLKKTITAGVNHCDNDYKDGKVSLGGNVLLRANCARLGAAETTTARGFVPGETMSVLRIEVKDGIIFDLISDPVYDFRFRANLKFAVPKGTVPEMAQAEQMIGDVFAIASGGPLQQSYQPSYQPGPPAPAPPVPASPTSFSAIAPPPAPPDGQSGAAAPQPPPPPPPAPNQPVTPAQQQPQTLKLGLSIEQVVGILGQPAAIADLGSKKIYTYRNPTIKVTFVDGKVTDMQ